MNTLKTNRAMRTGTKIVLKIRLGAKERLSLAMYGADMPEHKKVYTVSANPFPGIIHIKELNHGNASGYVSTAFEVVDPKGLSTEASRRLADLFEEREGLKELHPKERRYLPEEEIFTTEEEF